MNQLSFTISIYNFKKVIKHSVRRGKVGKLVFYIENKMRIGHGLGFKIPSSKKI
jgi:hypothetical protein